jgi:hypothetical protein
MKPNSIMAWISEFKILKFRHLITSFIVLYLLAAFCNCSKNEDEKGVVSGTWDIDVQGIPRFVKKNYIDLSEIGRISKFRSSIGHDYSDAYEHCRSMKHYFEPRAEADWTSIKIYSPVKGTDTRVEEEWAGTKIEIESENYPAFRFSIFHIHLIAELNAGESITEGQFLGNHIGSQTMSDISVIVNDPARQGRMVSYFDVIADEVFEEYSKRGISERKELIISKEERDKNPLICNGDSFISTDTLENWVVLK